MAPKLLTDCPENLREAIDWLVQVQHCGGVSTLSGALSTLFDNVAQDAEKSLPSLRDPDRPSARGVVSKLRAFQSTLPKDPENPNKNIIHNLCTSAGSLLGYQSPGTYDGSGIVYGNASRLCDAILAFLYAVFSDVHGNHPYVAGRDLLHNVIAELKSQLWRGHKGFCQVIPKVSTGLRDYNAAVTASNEKVKRPIETVLDYVGTNGELCRGIHALQVGDVTGDPDVEDPKVSKAVSLVEDCKEVARAFSKSFTAAKDAINDLNPKLKRRLENARKSFFNHVDWLSKWSNKGEKKRLDKMIQKIKSRLKRLANAVKDKIKQEVHTVVELLKKRVGEIKMKLEGITGSLEEYVERLGQWMGEAKKYINAVKEYVNDIMEELDGENKKKIDRAAADIDSELGKKVEELNTWIERAEAAVKAAKEKASEVFGRLEHNNQGVHKQTNVSKGIQQISEAKVKVYEVDKGLKDINDDLHKWSDSVKNVLDIAVSSAVNVHKQLDPVSSHPIGEKIKEIEEAKTAIDEANRTLGEQVNSLNKWIQDAEAIRQKAEQKAKEAYEKLDIHQELSNNVKKIVDASKAIKGVNDAVEDKLKELGTWRDTAEKVLEGAVGKAQAVHDALKDTSPISEKLKEIGTNNDLIKAANRSLESEVQHLGNWKDAAKNVIDKANKKCDEILKRVDKNHNGNEGGNKGPEIYVKANELQDQGKRLLDAAATAKKSVEEKVKSALDAVKAMDDDLKKDLFDVKEKIKDGIKKVIEELKVGELGEEVQKDLQRLRGNIEGLKGRVDERNGNGIVKNQLKAVGEAKTQLTEKTKEIKKQTKEMNKKFKETIKGPLDKNVKAVEDAIEKLYGQINPEGRGESEGDKKKLQKIFEHIKRQVADIKGSGKKEHESGIDGIVAHVRRLYDAFVDGSNSGVGARVDGWLGSILGINEKKDKAMEAVTSWITTHSGPGNENSKVTENQFKQKIKNALRNQMNTAQQKITAKDVSNEIVQNLTKVKEACDTFVEELDKQLTNTQIDNFVQNILTETPSSSASGSQGNNADNLKTAVKAALIALCSCVRQVAGEIDFLGISMFGDRIDKIKPTVDELDKNLKATTNSVTPQTGTAQAVDEAIKGVSKELGELEKKFEGVKKPVDEAVSQLDSAVTEYDKQAHEQVKKAAEKAIDEAANEISTKGHESQIDLKKKMGNFHQAHKEIADNLERKLQEKVNEQLPDESISGGQVQLRKSTKYQTHVDTSKHGLEVEGKLPAAIKAIGSEGLTKINEHIGKRGGAGPEITDQQITDSFEAIKKQLEGIVELVSDTKKGFLGEPVKNSSGLKTRLADLTKALGDGKLDGINKGLAEIQTVIEKLQKDTFGLKAEAISKAVKEIRKEVEVLKKKLLNERGKDIIYTLTDMRSVGLGSGEAFWTTVKGQNIGGLGSIQKHLQEHNEELPKQTKLIDAAIDDIRYELFQVGIRLSHKNETDDVIDQLDWLRRKIGMGDAKPGNLLKIKNEIHRLQSETFTEKPDAVGKAKTAMEAELKSLRGELYAQVTNPLKELIGTGFGDGENWYGMKAKGFDNIHKHLNDQQHELSPQPNNIQTGVDEVTNELQSLRTELHGTDSKNPQERGVIRNLAHLVTQIGHKDNEGLKNIKTEIESLNRSQVPLITSNLNTMSTEITNAAGQLGLNLNQLVDPHIDVKLKGIETGLTNLRLTDLAAAIKMCDDFLHKADEIERNTVHALWKHVDDEVDDAIKDLTKEARGLYVDSVMEALELFAKKVNEDLEQLPGDITHDLTIGFKGFMNAVEGENSENINKLKCVESRELKQLCAEFASFFGTVNDYVRQETQRVHDEQNKEQNPVLTPTDEPYTPKLNDVYEALTELLVYLRDNDGGTDRLTELVERLAKTLSNLVPSDFKHSSTPLLDTISCGLTKFASEFHNTYISAYSGKRCREEHAHKYAKVLLSMIPMTHQALTKLMVKCEGEWRDLHVSMFTADDRDNPLGNYLTRCGYMVPSSEGKQDGELNNMFTGGGIYELLITPIEGVAIEMMIDGEPLKNGIDFVTITSLLYNVLCHYFQACHFPVPPEPRYSCTVRDMLSWLSGLQYTQVADKLPEHCKALLNRRCHEGDTPNKEDAVMAKCIGELPSTIATTCSHSTALLTAIQGNGHGFDLAAYPYSVDFSNNRAGLHYPADPDALLDMLRDIVCRLCKVLYFLYSQCCRSTARVKGWRECAYGRQVQSHNWQCQQIGTYSSTISTTTATITSSTTMHGCPPTSPLQSFLSDSCHGLLPHTLTAADMKIECANCTANQPGQQCLTPLGFWDLGFAASIGGTGWDIAKRLGDMCRDADSCLFVLCRTLHFLCPAAPSSLADVFALYAQVLRQWDTHDRVRHRGGTYTDASDFISHLNTDGIDSLFPLWTQLHGSYENNKFTTAIASLAGHEHKSHDALSTLFNDSTCKSPSNCAPYLQPLGLHANHTYPRKHAGLYITWIMYLAWQFWELLTHLLHALDNIDCTASGCATCPCQPGTHGGKDTCHCPSIVQCAGPLPILYRYGFTYRNADLLVTANRTMRCGDLNTQLKEALHSGHFTELFRQIDQLIWHIRMPFLYFLIALWSLVALYILHTFLYRLDIFHIRSHLLTTKASHLIDVKALLIPSRKMLSLYNASYFDDDPAELLNLI